MKKSCDMDGPCDKLAAAKIKHALPQNCPYCRANVGRLADRRLKRIRRTEATKSRREYKDALLELEECARTSCTRKDGDEADHNKKLAALFTAVRRYQRAKENLPGVIHGCD